MISNHNYINNADQLLIADSHFLYFIIYVSQVQYSDMSYETITDSKDTILTLTERSNNLLLMKKFKDGKKSKHTVNYRY